jgi:hypothetical protein
MMRELAVKFFTKWAVRVYGPDADTQVVPITALLQPGQVQSMLGSLPSTTRPRYAKACVQALWAVLKSPAVQAELSKSTLFACAREIKQSAACAAVRNSRENKPAADAAACAAPTNSRVDTAAAGCKQQAEHLAQQVQQDKAMPKPDAVDTASSPKNF